MPIEAKYATLGEAKKACGSKDALDVPSQHQYGPSCGFYAVSLVMQYWASKGGPAAMPARWADGHKGTKKPKDGADHSLRQIGKRLAATQIGELWTADGMADVVRAVPGYDVEIVKVAIDKYEAAIRTRLAAGQPVIVPIDVGDGGYPRKYNGEHAHWVTIIGSFTATETEMIFWTKSTTGFLYTHWNAYFTSTAANFVASGFQLDKFRDSTWVKGNNYSYVDTSSGGKGSPAAPGSGGTAVFDPTKRFGKFVSVEFSGLRGTFLVVKPK
jgi:hypothetical protein